MNKLFKGSYSKIPKSKSSITKIQKTFSKKIYYTVKGRDYIIFLKKRYVIDRTELWSDVFF